MMRQLSAKKEFMLMKSHAMVAQERERAKKEKMMQVRSAHFPAKIILLTRFFLFPQDQNGEVIDCLVTAWSPWSQCDADCGRAFR